MKKFTSYILASLILLAAIAGLSSCSKQVDSASIAPGTGTGGSLARFIISMNHLYVVDNRQLHTFSISDPQNPVKVNVADIGFDVETIYAWKDKLFIGSRDAMYIYSITDPGQPALLGTASHVRACDPVVANDSIAYVTVRTGNNCGGDINALYVYDVKNVLQPVQQNVINLRNPYGLGLKDNTLFVCDAGYGLRVFDVSAPYHPTQIGNVTGFIFYDCIPMDNLLFCMVDGGVAIYDITDPNHIVFKAEVTE